MKLLRPFLVSALLLPMALACGDGATDLRPAGSFEATVSGDVSAALEGNAEFGVYTGEGFGLAMTVPGGAQFLGVGHAEEVRPDMGTYAVTTIDSEDQFFALYMVQTTQGLATLTSRSGDVTITTSTASRMEGTFNLVARGTVAGDPVTQREVFISGTFSATCAPGARCE